MNGSFCNLSPLTLELSRKKGETVVHRCDPALSVLVMLLSRNVFYVVSALQFIVCVNLSSRCSRVTLVSGFPCFDSCQLTITWISKIKEVRNKPKQPISWRMAAILRESVVVVHMRPRAIPLAMITMRILMHGFLLLSYMGMVLHLATLRTAGAPL